MLYTMNFFPSCFLQVEATDEDRGENGIVRYGIVSPSDGTFRIGREDGVITIGRDIDREIASDKFIQVRKVVVVCVRLEYDKKNLVQVFV